MNVYDSERMMGELVEAGYVEVEEDDAADLFVVNTCSVRDKPEQKVYSLLGRLRRYKRQRGARIVVAGCVAQQHGERLVQRAPFVDVVMGPDHTWRIVHLLKQAARTGRPAVATEQDRFGFKSGGNNEGSDPSRVGLQPPRIVRRKRSTAFVAVMKGCNQFCSYCIVPYTRGREESKGVEQVLAEVRGAVEEGAKEVTLLGQNVNRYGMDQPGTPGFVELLEKVHQVDGLARVKFVTSHPADCSDELIECFGKLEKLCPYFHLPLQSGSDRVLKAMNRRYDYSWYLNRVKRLREVRPDIHISTDLIVGFPGETEEDFERTLRAAHEVQWGSAFSFKYSPRPGTAAAAMADDVPEEEKKRRLEKLQAVLYHYFHRAMTRHYGKVEKVLVEGVSKRQSKLDGDRSMGMRQYSGRTAANYVVNIDASPDVGDLEGKLVDVKITGILPHSLAGRLVMEG